jgi:hypothetical protein
MPCDHTIHSPLPFRAVACCVPLPTSLLCTLRPRGFYGIRNTATLPKTIRIRIRAAGNPSCAALSSRARRYREHCSGGMRSRQLAEQKSSRQGTATFTCLTTQLFHLRPCAPFTYDLDATQTGRLTDHRPSYERCHSLARAPAHDTQLPQAAGHRSPAAVGRNCHRSRSGSWILQIYRGAQRAAEGRARPCDRSRPICSQRSVDRS